MYAQREYDAHETICCVLVIHNLHMNRNDNDHLYDNTDGKLLSKLSPKQWNFCKL